MPRHKGVFVPHPHCTVASGDCFTQGRCLGQCTARKKKATEARLQELERRLVELERQVYSALLGRGAGTSAALRPPPSAPATPSKP